MKRLIAIALLVAAGATSAQIQVSREGYVTTAQERARWMSANDTVQQYCIKANLMRFTEPMQKEYLRALKGIEAMDLVSAERSAALCKQGYEMGKAPAPVTKAEPQKAKGDLYGLSPETSTPRDIYLSTTSKVNQDRILALEKTNDWQMKVLPSFDCTKATAQTDLTICGNPYLSLLDQDLSSAYKQAMKNAKLTGDPAWMQADQRKWNKKLQSVKFASEIAYRQATRVNYLKDDTPDSQAPNW